MRALSFFTTVALCFTPMFATAAGFRLIDMPSDADGPALKAAIWYPCSQPPGEINYRGIILPGVNDCPITGERLPLVVISHGKGGTFIGHHDIAETLADAGFVVVALNHPGDNAFDTSSTNDLSVFIDRPRDVKRLIDFTLAASPAASKIDPERIGIFGFSRGGYTGLVMIGATPDWVGSELCQHAWLGSCDKVRDEARTTTLHDVRVKAAVIVDPLVIMFSAGSFVAIKVPVQLWASENGGDGVSLDSVAAVAGSLTAAHEYHVVRNAAHLAFLAPCTPALAAQDPEICRDSGGFDRIAFHKQFDAAVLAFFSKYLKPPA